VLKIGQKVRIKGDYVVIGYIVGITIDPIEEYEVNWEAQNYVTYTIRRYDSSLFKNGFVDYRRTGDEIEPITN